MYIFEYINMEIFSIEPALPSVTALGPKNPCFLVVLAQAVTVLIIYLCSFECHVYCTLFCFKIELK